MNNKNLLIAIILVSATILSGCATTTLAPQSADSDAKAFNATPNKSTIYLYRNESFGAALTMDVYLDDKFQGYTAANSYFMWVVDPGEHVIKSVAEDTETVTLETEPNKLYFVWQEVKMGFVSGGNDLHIVSDEEGKNGVNECKLIDSTAAEKILKVRNKNDASYMN